MPSTAEKVGWLGGCFGVSGVVSHSSTASGEFSGEGAGAGAAAAAGMEEDNVAAVAAAHSVSNIAGESCEARSNNHSVGVV